MTIFRRLLKDIRKLNMEEFQKASNLNEEDTYLVIKKMIQSQSHKQSQSQFLFKKHSR